MPTFIKTGLWEKSKKGFKGWLNLDDLIESFITPQSIVALTDGATVDISGTINTLTSSAAARTFTISSTSNDITLEVTLNTTDAVYTFPAGSLCVAEGEASGDNTLTLSGTSGDKYVIGIKKIGSNYRVVSKNFLQ